jgi:hypothetical protein
VVEFDRKTARSLYARNLEPPAIAGKLYYSMYSDTRAYVDLTILSTAKAIREHTTKGELVPDPHMTTVFVDGLRSRLEEHRFARGLRQLGVSARKVRGLDDQSEQFIRLADAIVRDGLRAQAVEPLYRLI